MRAIGEKTYGFAGYTLDLRRGSLFSGNTEIELRPKSFLLLRYLVENSGRLVTRDELINALWTDVIVTEESVTRCVSDVRKALGDSAQCIIKTLPKRGYVLTASVSEPGPPSSPNGAVTNTVATSAEGRPACPGERPAERRPLTVLSCKVIGLSVVSARLDPEDLRVVTAGCHKHCAEIIRRHRGYLARCHGDEVLAYFGYPEAAEHDAENAVRAGLALVESTATLGATCGSAIELRIGIATGLVVIGEEPATSEAKEPTAIGEAPDLAARVQNAAKAGHLVVAETTRRLVGGLFDCSDLGHLPAEGSAQPIRAWRVIGACPIESRFEALRRGITPLVGREEELALLLRRWQQTASGEGRVVLVAGEPGIGKSRLAMALQERLQPEPHRRLRYFCSPHHTDSAFYSVIARLERAAGFERNDASEAKLEKLSSLLGAPSHDESDLQLLAELLSIPVTDHLAPLNWSPQRKKEKTLEALLRQLETLSREERVFAVYEDVQWLDPSSRELLDMTVERVADLPVLLVITFRPDFQPPWAGQPHVSMVNLGRLSKREAAALAALVASHRALPDDITAAIVERTDGIPLFVEELTKAVLEASSHDENGRETIATAPLPTLAVPVSLHASLIARLDRLGTLAKEVAQIGAVIGREFSYELLAAVAQRSDHELRSIVGKLSDSGLVFCRGTPPRATLLFKHALVRDAAYASLLRSLRQQIHARIASALEDQRAEIVAVRPELLAHHFAEAGLLERAVSYRLEAGQQAAARSAITEAVMQLRNGLGLLARLPENTWGQRRELDLQIALGRALIAKEGWVSPAAGQAFERARQLCEYLNPLPQVVVRVVNGQYATRFNRGEFARARQLAEEMLQLGVAHRDVTAQVLGYRFHGQVCQMMGEFTAARANLERSLALYDPSRQAQYAALSIVDAHVLTHYFLSTTMRHLGYPDQARALEDAALAEARQLGHPLTLAQALSSFLWTEWGFQTEQILMEAAEELASLSAERGFAFHIALANALRGWCLTGLGRADEGLTLLADALETIQARGQNVRFPFLLLCYADGLGRSGQFAAGLERLDQAMQLIEATQGRYLEAPLHELRGRLLISMRERFAAEAVLRKAIEVAKDQNSKMLELHASTSLARLWRDQGKHGEAHNLLASIHGWFTEGFDTRSLKEAKALLEELD